MKLKTTVIPAVMISAGLLGCGGSSNNDNNQTDTGTLSLQITDAPIDNATEVVVKFDAIEIKPKDGPSFTITFDEPQLLDLLSLQNGTTAPLLQNQELDAGEYNWMRLMVDADRGETDSYISFDGGETYSLYVPSGSNTGLKLNRPFTIPAGGSANFTIDFDLRRSVHLPGNSSQDYVLRPTLRILDNTEVGTISGVIAADTVIDESCLEGLAVYAYEGNDITPDDVGSAAPFVTSSIPVYDADNNHYTYTLSYLLTGDYTLAVTCDAEADLPESDESENDWGYVASANATVTVNQTTEVNF
ncbi:DUF4382 domain-containing protein [Aliikangiella maris]|uniref:DUF4382 domain-containing protein n=2 Tax=Aliikangiella maris TaxID=3162458 RepID=A0ABV3MUT5_9GAMM